MYNVISEGNAPAPFFTEEGARDYVKTCEAANDAMGVIVQYKIVDDDGKEYPIPKDHLTARLGDKGVEADE